MLPLLERRLSVVVEKFHYYYRDFGYFGMVIRQVNNKVSIKVKGDAKVRMDYINDGSNDVNIVGPLASLIL